MSTELFNIVFYGIVQPGKDRNAVAAEMAALFKTTPEKIKPYFSGERRVIKSHVDDLGAEKYRVILEKIGLVIKVEPAEATPATVPAQTSASAATPASPATDSNIDTGDLNMAPPGSDVLENPVEVTPAPIGDISDISMAEVGADVLENPVEVTPAPIGDISDISMAEIGADVLENPVPVTPQPIPDISDISVAEPGADLLKNPPEKKAAPVPDISKLSLKENK